jgi:hypothetical protein
MSHLRRWKLLLKITCADSFTLYGDPAILG